jgi:hypothetical protein
MEPNKWTKYDDGKYRIETLDKRTLKVIRDAEVVFESWRLYGQAYPITTIILEDSDGNTKAEASLQSHDGEVFHSGEFRSLARYKPLVVEAKGLPWKTRNSASNLIRIIEEEL